MRWAGHVACMGEERKVYKVLVGKPEGKWPLGRSRHRWEDGIRMDLREIGLGGVDWIQLSQDRDRWRAIVSAVMNFQVLVPWSYLVNSLWNVTDLTKVLFLNVLLRCQYVSECPVLFQTTEFYRLNFNHTLKRVTSKADPNISPCEDHRQTKAKWKCPWGYEFQSSHFFVNQAQS
jgi:hypothetical protein